MIAFVYPGQGSQYVGMGKEIADRYPSAAELFVRADRLLGFPLSRYCFEGPAEELMQNDVVQPAILVSSLAVHSALKQEGLTPDLVAGLSVGEYTALVAAGSLSFDDALLLVRKRGTIMKNALPPGTGGMLAIIGLERDLVLGLCGEAAEKGTAEPCNYNCPGQIVVGGPIPAIEALEVLAMERGAKKVSRVAMSSPSHCSLLKPAAELFKKEMDGVPIEDARLAVISNVDARPVTSASRIRENLSRQLYSTVLWEDTIKEMEKMGVKHIVEVGPGHTLLGFVRKTLKGMPVNNVEDLKTMDETLEAFGRRR
ncbi:MAG: ACP S-malonyltransferase [Firmicutes bacterium]|nr:ACP S-malonyltransferase [Bacillota bacterium]